MRLSLELVHSLAEEPRGKAGSRFVPLMTLRDLRRIFSSGGAWFHLGVPPSRICSFTGIYCLLLSRRSGSRAHVSPAFKASRRLGLLLPEG
ncbi:hypothetical protein F2Q70_00028009 [Brassica cretica]|uniref:Uncharacterized protein n=1 Tax=Brassica cretica TaxID=69181 RepID=A0A8S9L775_BRACR|nr:hypothetical protein F2Q70_00028009 [Brassica cretica]